MPKKKMQNKSKLSNASNKADLLEKFGDINGEFCTELDLISAQVRLDPLIEIDQKKISQFILLITHFENILLEAIPHFPKNIKPMELDRHSYARLGEAYLHCKNKEKAHFYLNKALSLGDFKSGFHLLKLVNSKKAFELIQSMLDIALDPFFKQKAMDMNAQLRFAAQELFLYSKNTLSKEGLKTFIDTYAYFLKLEVEDYLFMVESHKKASPDKALVWLDKLLVLKKIQPQLDIPLDFLEEIIPDIALHYTYIAKKNLKCLNLITKYQAYLSPITVCLLSCIFFDFQKQGSLIDLEILKKAFGLLESNAKKILMSSERGPFFIKQTAPLQLSIIFNQYFSACIEDKYTAMLSIEKLRAMFQTAFQCDSKQIQGIAYFHYGKLYEQGHKAIIADETLAGLNYKQAADLGNGDAVFEVGRSHAEGLNGFSIQLPAAISYCEKAVQQGNFKAGIYLAKLYSRKFAANSLEALLSQLQQLETMERALVEIRASEAKLLLSFKSSNVCNVAKKNQEELLNEIYFLRAHFLLELEQNHSKQPLSPASKQTIVNNLTFAVACTNKHTALRALLYLGNLHFYGHHVEKDFAQAKHYFKRAVVLAEQLDELSLEMKIVINLCLIYHQNSIEEKETSKKSLLYNKCLTFYQRALHIIEMKGEMFDEPDAPLEELNTLLRGNFSAFNLENYLSQHKPLVGLLKPSQFSPWQDEITALKKLLHQHALPPTLETLQTITQHLVNLGEHRLKAQALFPPLSALVQQFAIETAPALTTENLILAMNWVGKWLLADASANLQGLFMYVNLEKQGLREWSHILKAFAYAGFSKQLRSLHIEPLLKKLGDCPDFSWEAACENIPASARFLHALALLASGQFSKDQPSLDDVYGTLAGRIFKQLKQEDFKKAGFYDISQIYHAHHLFQAKYPKVDWPIHKSLDARFKEYSLTLETNVPRPSHIQAEMYQELLKAPGLNVRQEVLIKKAGRRVDFKVNDTYLQYHGSIFHFFYDNQGHIKFMSLASALCQRSIELANVKIKIINRLEWQQADSADMREQLLQIKLSLNGKGAAASSEQGPGLYSRQKTQETKETNEDDLAEYDYDVTKDEKLGGLRLKITL